MGCTRALRRNGIPRDPDLNVPLPKRLLKNKFFWLTVVMILVYATMLVLLYLEVVLIASSLGGTLPGLGKAIPSREVRRYYGDPVVLALLVGRPVPTATVLGVADDVRWGVPASRPSFLRRSTPGRPSTSASLATVTGDCGAGRDLRRPVR